MCTWHWLADLWAQDGIACVLGHALSMKASHGGKAKNDKIDSHKIAVGLRGGLRPQAYGYPAQMRATRDLLRRRTHLMRKRAALLAHVHNTNSQYNLPAIGRGFYTVWGVVRRSSGQRPAWPSHALPCTRLWVCGQECARLRQFRTPIALAGHRHQAPKIALRLCHGTALRRGRRRT